MSAVRPNILLITTDQQRFDTIGDAKPPFLRTPHIDLLGYQGVQFTRAYADCPLCVPARVGIMTGKQVFTHGVANNEQTSMVMGREATLPTYLRACGYQTAAIGKMHFGPQRVRHGFEEMILPDDYYRELRHSGSSLQPMHHGMGQNELYPTLATVPESLTMTSWIAERCVEYILVRRDPTLPFFLWCSFAKPHPPLDAPEPYYSMYRNSPIPAPAIGEWRDSADCPISFQRQAQRRAFDSISDEAIHAARAVYYGLITQIDHVIGRIISALEDSGLFNDTFIMFASDHGEMLGDHRNGAKTFFYEPAARVPFILRMPQSWENRRHGTTVDSPITHADILPTLVGVAGGTQPSDSDGQDLVSLARGELEHPRRYLEAMSGPRWPQAERIPCVYMALTDGQWKYIWYPEGPTEQLFNLAEDPSELQNLAGEARCASQKQELKSELIARLRARESVYLEDGNLPAREPQGDTIADRRNTATNHAGFRTEYSDLDVRH